MSTLLVAIPVWPGDYDVVLANLKRQLERDGESKHSAIVFIDSRLTVEQGTRVMNLAGPCFKSIKGFPYVNAKEGNPWPEPHNFTWQLIARSMENHQRADGEMGWFMWESDALPLKKGWIDTLADAYVKGKKPFMGHIVPNRGHMNAVAVYPFNVSHYTASALLTKKTPFDVALSKEVGNVHITKANHLIEHHLKTKGGDPAKILTPYLRAGIPETCVIIHGYCEPTTAQIEKHHEQRKIQAMNETSKAMRRRRCEEAGGGFKWSKVFQGSGVDVGAGGDPIQLPNCKPFDMHDGDANFLSGHFAQESLDYVHASQCLEHMVDPRSALLNWALCVKKGGYIVATVPHWVLYEHQQWPSKFNADHKSAWSMDLRGAPNCPVLIHVPTFTAEMKQHGLPCLIQRTVDTNYDYTLGPEIDQTFPEDGAEAWVELVFQKV